MSITEAFIACFVTEGLLWAWYNLDGKPWYQHLLFWCADGAVGFIFIKRLVYWLSIST